MWITPPGPCSALTSSPLISVTEYTAHNIWRRRNQLLPLRQLGEREDKELLVGRSQDGRGIGRGDHSLSYKFIKRITERRTNFTKQLLIASWGHQAPRKATHCLRKEVGQNIKDKKREKRAKDRDPSREGSLALVGLGEVFESQRATWLGGEQQIKPTDYVPKSNSQQKSTPDTRIRRQQVGAEERGAGGNA